MDHKTTPYPPAYTTIYPPQGDQAYFPPASEFGQQTSGFTVGNTGGVPYPPGPTQSQVQGNPDAHSIGFVGGNKGVPYPAGQPQPQNYGYPAGVGVVDPPQAGFFVHPNSSASAAEASENDEPKFTPFHDDISGYAFSEKSIRMAFIRKVFGILSVQLSVVTAVIALFVYHKGVKGWMSRNFWFLIFSCLVYFATAIILICCESVRRKAPQNFIFLGVFTGAASVLVGSCTSYYKEESVLLAGGVTVVVCVSLTIFAFQTKIDFTRFSGILFVLFIVLILFGFMTIFLRHQFPVTRMIYNALGALLFSAYLVHDVQLLVGGNHKYAISPEEYIFAALTIFLDVINIFLYLLRLFGQRN